MKRIVIGTVLALLVSVVAFAKTANFVACTTDNQLAVLTIQLNDQIIAQHPVETHIAVAFTAAASSMTAADLVTSAGFVMFRAGLDDIDIKAVEDMSAPLISGSCK